MAVPQGTFVAFLLLAVTLSSSNPISTVTAGEKIVNEDYRLKNVVEPLHYDLDLTIADNFVTTKVFKGLVKIQIKLKDPEVGGLPKNKITLHMKHITFTYDDVKLYDEANEKTNLLDTTTAPVLETTLEMVTFTIGSTALVKNNKYILEIPYTGELHEDMYGFYLSSYEENGKTEHLITTQFQPTHARRAFPCFDEPNIKATFEITINHPKAYHALSNTRGTPAAVGTTATKTTFAVTPKMSTYLIAFIVSKFSTITDNIHNSVFAQNQLIRAGGYAFDISPKILEAMESFTDVLYSVANIGKMDNVAIPDFSAGAMENWGLITYRENALLWDAEESTAQSKQRVATVIAHELAHMWFGNLITCDWWEYTWLNEGFARYYQYFATAQVENDWGLGQQFVVEQQQSVLNSDSLITAQALTSAAFSPAQISAKFGTITYNKGASVIRMMQNFLGNATFSGGIKEYLKAPGQHFKNVKPKDLWDAITKASGGPKLPIVDETLQTVMTPWTEKSGFPVVTVSVSEDDKVALKAERFLFHKEKTDDTKNIWFIPISYTTAAAEPNTETTAPKAWIKPTDTEIKLDYNSNNGWILVNVQSSAYIRVNYDSTLWKKLEDALKNNHENINVMNRAQIVDDAMNLARATTIETLTYTSALDILQYLEKETDYYPWYSAFNAFAYLKRRIDGDSELAAYLNRHISNLMEKLYKSVSFEGRLEQQLDIHKQVLTLKWACELQNEECVQKAKDLFESLQKNHRVSPDLRGTVYCTAIRNSDNSENWKFLWERFTQTKLASEAATMITALGCSKDETILNDYLTKSITKDSGIRPQDGQSVFTAVISGNPEGVQIGLDFLIENFKEIRDTYGGMNALTTVLTSLADRLTTETQLETFKKFVKDNKDELGAAADAAQGAIETCEQNLEWVVAFQDDLLVYLKDKAPEVTSPSSSSSSTSTPTPSTTTVSTTTQGSASITASFAVVLLSILSFVNL